MRSNIKAVLAVIVCLAMLLAAACSASHPAESESAQASVPPEAPAPAESPDVQQIGLPSRTKETGSPKYVFLFIGDGMSFAQVNAAQIFKAADGDTAIGSLSFTVFPVTGTATTFDLTSVIPDSASAATAMACGIKTQSGMLGMTEDDEKIPKNIAELFKENGGKVGIVSTVSLNNATPAAFYAHTDSRGDYDDIARQMAQSGIDYFGGGSLVSPSGSKGQQADAFDLFAQNGYAIADTKEKIMAVSGASGKTYAVSPALQSASAMPFSLDAEKGGLTLADFVRKGIDALDNEKGFFMMCESGMIDWACHANDAMTAISETLVLEDAVAEAVGFAQAHPEETLIVVTGDHETGGMAIGCADTGYNTRFSLLKGQTLSYSAFDAAFQELKKSKTQLLMSDVMPLIKRSFGLAAPDDTAENLYAVLTSDEYQRLLDALEASLNGVPNSDEAKRLYGGYEPLTVTLTHILDNKAGIGWTTYAHTGGLVPVYAYGRGSEMFAGSYDNTDIFKKLAKVCGLNAD